MNYAKIKHWDIANGSGIRVSLFVSGCNFHCKGCFNQEAWDFHYGEPFTDATRKEIISLVSDANIDGLSILGGDPLWQGIEGLDELIRLCKEVHRWHKNVWLWTGFTWEEIFSEDNMTQNKALQQQLIKECDVVVDGRFDESLKDLNLVWKGSKNQRVIDVKRSLDAHKIIEFD